MLGKQPQEVLPSTLLCELGGTTAYPVMICNTTIIFKNSPTAFTFFRGLLALKFFIGGEISHAGMSQLL